MTEMFDAAIVGGGIVGAACARECAERGLRVALVEGRGIASGATGAAMGHVVAMNDSPAQLALTHYSQALWQRMSSSLPAGVEYRRPGTLWIANGEEEMLEVERKNLAFAEAGIHTEIVHSKKLSEAEPQLRPMAGALLVPSDAVVDPAFAAGYFVQQAQQRGARLYNQSALSAADGEVRLADGSSLRAARIVNAAGADAARVTPGLPIRKRKGHLLITAPHPGFVRHQLVELAYLKSAHGDDADSVAFNVQPRNSGQILIGSSRQYGTEDAAVEEPVLNAIMERARHYMPEIGSLNILRSWTGFRAATPDKLPLIGPWPDDASLFIATGHEGLGITTSLGTARLLADCMLGTKPEIPIDPYLPARFAVSNRAKEQQVVANIGLSNTELSNTQL